VCRAGAAAGRYGCPTAKPRCTTPLWCSGPARIWP
jgi:hypothetical protein